MKVKFEFSLKVRQSVRKKLYKAIEELGASKPVPGTPEPSEYTKDYSRIYETVTTTNEQHSSVCSLLYAAQNNNTISSYWSIN